MWSELWQLQFPPVLPAGLLQVHQVLTKLFFQAVLSISSSILCSFPGELCAFHTHYETGRNVF